MNSSESLLKLEERIQKEKNKTIKYVLLYELADASVKDGKLDYAFLLYTEALNVAREMKKVKLECNTLVHLGEVADDLGKIDLAIDFYKDGLLLAQINRSFRVQSRILGKLAYLFMRSGNIDLSAEYFKQAADAAHIADSRAINIRPEQTTNKPIPSDITTGSNLSSTIQKSLEVSDQIKQTEHLRIFQRYTLVAVAIFLVIIVAGLGIFSHAASNPVIYLAIGLSSLGAIGAIYILGRALSSTFNED